MILPQDISPERSLYYLGYKVLDLLKLEKGTSSDPKNLYDRFLLLNPESRISFNYFLYALDWLYLLNLVQLNENVRLEKCF